MKSSKAILPKSHLEPANAANDSIQSPQLVHDHLPKKSSSNVFIQPKLIVGSPDDPLEHEADRVADTVMRMPEQNFIQRKCDHCEEEEHLQRKSLGSFIQKKEAAHGHEASDQVSNKINAAKNNGSELDTATRSFMESRFGTGFDHVKIHSGQQAHQLNDQLSSKAFTVGNDIFFNEGQYNPGDNKGKHLLAHELTHVIQQSGHTISPKRLVQRDLKEEQEMLKSKPPVLMLNPFATDEESAKELADYELAKTTYNDKLRETALAPLFREKGPDGITFSNRLRSLSADQAHILVNDDIFFNKVRTIFKGSSLWIIYNILNFNNRVHDPYRSLNRAMSNKDARLLMDMLSIIIGQYKNDRYYVFLKEVVQVVFSGDPLLKEIIRLIDHRNDPGISYSLTGNYEEVHYEDGTLKQFGGSIGANAYMTGDQLRVIVRIHFLDGSDATKCPTAGSIGCKPFPFSGEFSSYPEKWTGIMKKYWNDKLTITNGNNTYQVRFEPMVLPDPGNNAINVRVMPDKKQRCAPDMEKGRSNQTCWFLKVSEGTIAHEFGHILGASDEYSLPGSYKEVKDAGFNLSPTDMVLTTVEGIRGFTRRKRSSGYNIRNSIMNDTSDNVQTWHLSRLILLLNSKLPANIPPFLIHKK